MMVLGHPCLEKASTIAFAVVVARRLATGIASGHPENIHNH